MPERPRLEGLEDKWRARWEEEGTYQFDRTKARSQIFSIDTPPPTVSGNLHPGHVFSFTHTDLIARYQRMKGREVFYPMGWDDNGLNVERRVQLLTGTIVDPGLPYEPNFAPPDPLPDRPRAVSRPNFVELCQQVVPQIEASYHEVWSKVGLSVDWTQTYTTIGPKATRLSQLAFLRLLDRGLCYRTESPTLWDVDMRTAVAQAELQDRETSGAYYRLAFGGPGGEPIFVDTTRPELVPACVALVAHPDDQRYQAMFGSHAMTPVFGVKVPIVAHELGDPEKGTGIAMVCTFGDTTDVTWWREMGLDLRAIVQRDGRLRPVAWGEPGWESVDAVAAQTAYDRLVGKTTRQAQKLMVELLEAAGALHGEPRSIIHAVKFWENGTRPLEIVTSHQWFIKYPDREALLERSRELRWWPEFMQVRFENWVNGLTGDWNITRQRFFGVPFPIWYPIDSEGEIDYLSPIPATAEMLPVDPTTVPPPGYEEGARNKSDGFAADPDVMDTWATSSLTAFIVSGWQDDPDLFARTFPMDLRAQGHDIIRTWLFSSVVRAHYEIGALPWYNAAISGFIVDPDRKKLSKSAGNQPDDPMSLIARFGADAVRYWAAQGRPGIDLAFDEGQMKIGRRLATKVLNASRFILGLGADSDSPPTDPLDRAMLASLAGVVGEATEAFERFEYARAFERTEEFFWPFCDDYLELVKNRAYGSEGSDGRASAISSLRMALVTILKLFAPFLPYTTEEVWSWWKEGSIHRSTWPDSAGLTAAARADAEASLLTLAGDILREIRKAKTEAQVSMRAEVARMRVAAGDGLLSMVRSVEGDLRNAGVVVAPIELIAGDGLAVEVELAATG
ncbi:MAG: valine--tRNA ligase [Actinomycetota bacterium]